MRIVIAFLMCSFAVTACGSDEIDSNEQARRAYRSLAGTYHMTGDIKGDVTLNLTFSGMLADDGAGHVIRAPGTTSITGTATTANNGAFTVDLMR